MAIIALPKGFHTSNTLVKMTGWTIKGAYVDVRLETFENIRNRRSLSKLNKV